MKNEMRHLGFEHDIMHTNGNKWEIKGCSVRYYAKSASGEKPLIKRFKDNERAFNYAHKQALTSRP